MPQATRPLQEKWDHDNQMDAKAITHLKNAGFEMKSGIIRAPAGYTPTEDDYSAIDYLCQEWDYGWEGLPEKGPMPLIPQVSRPFNPAYRATWDAMTPRERQWSFIADMLIVGAVLLILYWAAS